MRNSQLHSSAGTRRIAFAILLTAALACSGCNRGDRPAQVATKAPDISIHDGVQSLRLDEFRGKIVVLHFWTAWCPYCPAEFPSLMQLQKQMPNVAVLAVSFDEDPALYRQFLLDNHITGITTILDVSQKSNLAFGTTRPPETYIIGPRGTIRRKFIGPQDWTSPEILNYLRNL